ncbi:MAG: diaminopimelate decarboxylase [Pseudomonadota bacterium]|nr:diaminopimelate decarboxylase [Rhodocyclaceae bacterium]
MIEIANGVAHIEAVPIAEIAARYGTPCFVYSRAALENAFHAYREALAGRPARICYAVKANSNLSILKLFASLGAGFDIVSGGELARVIAAGGDPGKVVFSGVGKTRAEMQEALAAGIFCFNVESASELEHLNAVAGAAGKRAPIALRVNPDVDPKTHPYISTGLRSAKFGVPFDSAIDLYRRAKALPHLEIRGIACHIGSQLIDPLPAADAAGKILELVDLLTAEGITFSHIDLGGGMGIRYRDEPVLPVADYLAPMLNRLAGRQELLLLEPGRSLVGNAGLLLTRVEILKHGAEKNFAVVDAAMNDLARPALYDAYHEIVKVGAGGTAPAAARRYEIVGPVCESGDFLGHDRELALAEGDLLAILSAGAYGMAMSSNYNSRPRAAEIMVDGKEARLIRKRETIAELMVNELPYL